MSAARKAAEAFIAVGHVWDGPTCIRAVEIITSLLAEQPEAGNAMPDAVRAARDTARAAIDREGGPMTPWGLDMCAVLDSLDDWEREGPAPSPARDEVREAAEEMRTSLRMRESQSWCGRVACDEVRSKGWALLAALSSPPAAPARDEVREARHAVGACAETNGGKLCGACFAAFDPGAARGGE